MRGLDRDSYVRTSAVLFNDAGHTAHQASAGETNLSILNVWWRIRNFPGFIINSTQCNAS